jgi:hypothetical protein
VLHELREVLDVAPESIDLVDRRPDRDRALDRDLLPTSGVRPAARRLGDAPAAQVLAGEPVNHGHAQHGGGGGRDAVLLRPCGGHGTAQERQVHHVPTDARPDRRDGPIAGEDADAARDLAEPDREHRIPVRVVIPDPYEPGHPAGRRHLGEPESDAEPAQPASALHGVAEPGG